MFQIILPPSDAPRGTTEDEVCGATWGCNPHLQMHRAGQLKATNARQHWGATLSFRCTARYNRRRWLCDSIVVYTSPSDAPRGTLESEGYASTLLSNSHFQMHRAVQLKATDVLGHYTTNVMS